jgi:phenylpyruvate tautomerase PptA (4-oxalocrotonate tautomerase family)
MLRKGINETHTLPGDNTKTKQDIAHQITEIILQYIGYATGKPYLFSK